MAKAQGGPAPAAEVWWKGLRWLEGAWMQAERFEVAFYELQSALFDAQMRKDLNASDDDSAAWRASYDRDHPRFDPRRPIRVPTWALAMQAQTDLDLLIVAVRNVLRAQVRLPGELRTEITGENVLELLRNVAEHWDERGGRSAEELARAHPDVSVDVISFTNKEIWVGGIKDGIPLSRIRAWLGRVRSALVTALEADGTEVPDDMASMVAGDDELQWPSDRRRYALWSVPTVDMKEWPTEAVSRKVTELLAERFRALRGRDATE